MRLPFLLAAIASTVLAADQQWPLDSWPTTDLKSHGGTVKVADGVVGKSLQLDGRTTVQVSTQPKASAGFTAAIWLNAYATNRDQQMIIAKNRYSLDEREWGVMVDRDGRIKLYVWQGSWLIVDSGHRPKPGHWLQIAVSLSSDTATIWINGKRAKSAPLKKPVAATPAPLTFGGVNDNGRIWQNLFGALDEAKLYDRVLSDAEVAALYQPVAAVHQIPAAPIASDTYRLWSGPEIPRDLTKIPFAEGIEHRTIHDARQSDYKFLHGAAIINYKGTFFANWANSPKHENYPDETLQGRRAKDPLGTWSDVEMIGPGFEGKDRHSHGVYMIHKGELWTFAARFGVGTKGKRFSGLGAEAFVLNETTNKWENRGRVMDNCWPYDEPVKLANGNFITGGQDKDGLPVIAISHGDNLLKWDSILIPYPKPLEPRYAETTVWAFDNEVIAVIRGGRGVAWVAISKDYGQTWSQAQRSNLPMPRAKAYLGQLSTGQLYLVHNLQNRDTLAISVGKPGDKTLSKTWRIRHGKSVPPRFDGRAKAKQWSYPYGYEHEGKLYIVYSIGKEDCGLSVIPISSLAVK